MINGESLKHWLRLTLIPGIGGHTQRKLLAAFGLPDAVFLLVQQRYGRWSGTKRQRFCLKQKTTLMSLPH